MLACIKDWELGGKKRLQRAVDNQELKDSFKNLFLGEDASGAGTSASVASIGT
jgi:TorA maturation chaperone TorD